VKLAIHPARLLVFPVQRPLAWRGPREVPAAGGRLTRPGVGVEARYRAATRALTRDLRARGGWGDELRLVRQSWRFESGVDAQHDNLDESLHVASHPRCLNRPV